MPLPINIHEHIYGSTVEWERIEFKEEGARLGLSGDQVALIQKIVKIVTNISPTLMSVTYSSRKSNALH